MALGSQRWAAVAQGVATGANKVTLTFPSGPAGMWLTGTVTVLNSENTAVWQYSVGSAIPVGGTISAMGTWQGPTSFGPVQTLDEETLTVVGTGVTAGANYIASWVGSADPAGTVDFAWPSSSVAATAVGVTSQLAFGHAGIVVGTEAKLNFVDSNGITWAVIDNPAQGRVDVTPNPTQPTIQAFRVVADSVGTLVGTDGSGTWTKPPSATIVEIHCISGGVGGQSGQGGPTGGKTGGDGGDGGGYSIGRFAAGELTPTLTVTVGCGGAGATGIAGAAANGGTPNTTFVAMPAVGTIVAAAPLSGTYATGAHGARGNSAAAGGSPGVLNCLGGGGGGGGAGILAAGTVPAAGGAGGLPGLNRIFGPPAGGVAGTGAGPPTGPGGAGVNGGLSAYANMNAPTVSSGGGGGGSGTAGGHGGDGGKTPPVGTFGGGGGGGGASDTGVGGNGGAGGSGIVVIYSW